MADDRAYLVEALPRMRQDLCRVAASQHGRDLLHWRLLIEAAKAHIAGKECPGYRGDGATARLVADIAREFPEGAAA